MNKTNLSAYMAMTVSQLKEEQRMGTAHVYQSTLNRIKDFMSRTPSVLKRSPQCG